jgi:hypothetical protein
MKNWKQHTAKRTFPLIGMFFGIMNFVMAQNVNDFKTDGNGTITAYEGRVTALVIPTRIGGIPTTGIGEKAFRNNQLTSVTIPVGVTFIGEAAFSGNQLTSVVIPSGVTSIEALAFEENRLTSVVIPIGVTTIGEHAFASNQLTSVIIPSGITITSAGVFFNNKLTSVTIPTGVTHIGWYSFERNQLTNITIPDSVTYINTRAFNENKLTSIIIPAGVTSIGDNAFANNQLTSVTIPNSVASLKMGAFANNRLTSIIIGNGITSIEPMTFQDNQLTSITIPAGVKTIEGWAFTDNQLTSVTIGSNVLLGTEGLNGILPAFDDGFDNFYNANGKRAGTYIFNNGNWTIQGQRIGNQTQNGLLSITWVHGDTIETLKSRNPNHNFKLDNDLSVKSYVVVEGREPTITETTFIFGLDSRLVTIIYKKVGATLDVYNPLFQRFKTIYGNPKENNEFGINQHHTRINGFNVFTGDSKFENSKGSVILFVVASESNNIPYVLFTETYKY